jgi:hypothetical protein
VTQRAGARCHDSDAFMRVSAFGLLLGSGPALRLFPRFPFYLFTSEGKDDALFAMLEPKTRIASVLHRHTADSAVTHIGRQSRTQTHSHSTLNETKVHRCLILHQY